MKYIVANWKANMLSTDVNTWLTEFTQLTKDLTFKSKVLLAPTAGHLHIVKHWEKLAKKIAVCGQDVSEYELGAHTGEMTAQQLGEVADFCIIGHSERQEVQTTVLKKGANCLAANVIPIICFVDKTQLANLYAPNIICAWEDPQNISKNGVYRDEPLSNVRNELKIIKETYPECTLLYGGSVNPTNAGGLAAIKDLDGVLVGHASLNPNDFLAIINEFEKNAYAN